MGSNPHSAPLPAHTAISSRLLRLPAWSGGAGLQLPCTEGGCALEPQGPEGKRINCPPNSPGSNSLCDRGQVPFPLWDSFSCSTRSRFWALGVPSDPEQPWVAKPGPTLTKSEKNHHSQTSWLPKAERCPQKVGSGPEIQIQAPLLMFSPEISLKIVNICATGKTLPKMLLASGRGQLPPSVYLFFIPLLTFVHESRTHQLGLLAIISCTCCFSP